MDAMVRICDVYGGKRNVGRYLIEIKQIDCLPGVDTIDPVKITADLSDRAFDRLAKFLHRGITPPNSSQEATEHGQRELTPSST